MKPEELRERLVAIYKQHGMDTEGMYEGREFCTARCCYPQVERDEEGCVDVMELMYNVAPAGYWAAYPANYPSVDALLSRYERAICQHNFVAQGPSSLTTSGMKILYRCEKCGSSDYRAS